MSRLALALVILLPGLGAPLACAGDEAIVVDLAWASGKRESYRGQPIAWNDGAKDGVRVPVGPDAVLLIQRIETDEKPGLRLDRDFDGDLDDEKPLDFTEFPKDEDAEFDSQASDVVHPPWAPAAGLTRGVPVYFRLHAPTGEPATCAMTVRLHRRGHVVLEGRERLVALYDGNGDLRLDHPTEDQWLLDVDGDRTVARAEDSHERVRPGEPFQVRAGGYVASVDDPLAPHLRLERSNTLPPPRRPWKPAETPPAGVEQEGAGTSLEVLLAEYREKRALLERTNEPAEKLWSLVREIGQTGRPEAFSLLLEIVRKHESPALRRTAVKAMGDVRYADFGGRLTRIAQQDKDLEVQMEAMRALHRMNAPKRLGTLVRVARKTEDWDVYAEAVKHLGYLGTPEAHVALRKLLKSNRREVYLASRTYEALTRYAPELPSREVIEEGLRSKGLDAIALALEDARRLPHPEPRDLALSMYQTAFDHDTVRTPVLEILGADGDAASVRGVFRLAPEMTNDDRARVTALLGATRDPQALKAIREGLTDAQAVVRSLAAGIAVHLPDPKLASLIANRLRKERDEATRRALLEAAGAHAVVRAIPHLLAVLRDPEADDESRAIALESLLAIGPAHAEATESLMELAKTAPWEVRYRLLEVAEEGAAPGALPLLLQGLSDESWWVRLRAVEGLAKVRLKASIEALIERLAAEDEPRVRRAVVMALFRITGENLYDVVDVWRRWWKEKGGSFEVPMDVPERRESNAEGRYGEFFGVPVDSRNVIFVIDQSGSMDVTYRNSPDGKTDFQRAVAATREVLARLPNGAFVNVILFETYIHPWNEGLVRLGRTSRKSLDTFLGKQQPTGGTSLYEALEMALKTPDVETIYLLSDGSPSRETEEILAAVERWNRKNRVVIHAVALGWGSEFLRELAERTYGTYAER